MSMTPLNILLLLTLPAAFGIPTLSNDPSGMYCGKYSFIIKDMVLNMTNATSVDISATVFGTAFNCTETILYNETNSTIELVDFQKPDDCLGLILDNYGVQRQLEITYKPNIDEININAEDGAAIIVLTHDDCSPVTSPPSKSPALSESVSDASLRWVKFLVTVNDTWYPEEMEGKTCMETAVTAPLVPGTSRQSAPHVKVGGCDSGPLVFNVSRTPKGYRADVVFFSSVIEDASPPACSIEWNGKYTPPASTGESSPLPSCFAMDSREGYHMTNYWFHLLEWAFE